MGYAQYFRFVSSLFWYLVCGRLLADLDSSHISVVMIYTDVRDNNTMDNSTI